MGAQPDTLTSTPEVWHGVPQILAQVSVAAHLATYLALGTTATSYAANDMPQIPTHRAMQPSPRINLDRAYAFRQIPPNATDTLTIIPPQTTVPRGPRAANDFNWLAGSGG